MNVYPPAPDQLYKKVFQSPRMRGDGGLGLACHQEASWLCIITVRPPPVAQWVFGPAWFQSLCSQDHIAMAALLWMTMGCLVVLELRHHRQCSNLQAASCCHTGWRKNVQSSHNLSAACDLR